MFGLDVAESVLLLLGRCKYRRDVSVVCVNTSVSQGNKLGGLDTAMCYTGQLLRLSEVVACTSLLCVASVSTVNVTLDTTLCLCAEDERSVSHRPREC